MNLLMKEGDTMEKEKKIYEEPIITKVEYDSNDRFSMSECPTMNDWSDDPQCLY